MTDLFEGTPKDDGTPDATPAEGVSSTDTYLGLILNDEGEQKYKTAEEALKGSVHAQAHITNLEAELKELRTKSDKNDGLEEVLEALRKKTGDDKPPEQAAGISADDIAKQVETMLVERDVKTATQSNIATVVNTFKKLYGDKASETMYKKADDLGFNENEINSMIATNPKAALTVLGIGKDVKIESDPVTSGGGMSVDLSSGKPVEKPETIMGATNSKQLTDAWKLSQEATNKRLGVENLP